MRTRDIRGFTLIELLIVVAVIGTLSAIAVPGLLRSRISANEAAAVGSLRTVTAAQEDYNALNRGYADDLANLAVTCPGMNVPFVSEDLSVNDVVKSGYKFNVVAGLNAVAGPNDCNGNTTQTTFYATSIPETIAYTGYRAFASNVSMTIWQDSSGVAPSEPFAAGGTVAPLGQ